MIFEVGDKVENMMRERDGIIVGSTLDAGILLVDYDRGAGAERTSVKYLNMLKKKSIDRADIFRQVMKNDPDALKQLADYFISVGGYFKVCCCPRYVEKVAAKLSSMTRLSATEAVDYIIIATEKMQGDTYITVFDAKDIPIELADRLGMILWTDGTGKRAKKNETQINNRCVAEYLMKNYGLLPVKQR